MIVESAGALTDEDRAWIDDALARALATAPQNTFVHGDDALDIVRQACSYLDTEPELAAVFVESCATRAVADGNVQHGCRCMSSTTA
jgi:hypothetical protein